MTEQQPRTRRRRILASLMSEPQFESRMTRESFIREWKKERGRQYRSRTQPHRIRAGFIPREWPTEASELYAKETDSLLAAFDTDPASIHAVAADHGVTIEGH
ncbi:hypothetical protein [Yimella sp. cx-51]|uniref:hypothetical protein n=1 Tax=Yimella sp. cx-51 TaxID=2770551 RepID=UPI00165E6FC3|nr:hypothetical protein [Yimella sp. cx-51]MBC9958367.1 hypothetical protein [Yimella sp. cx-51]QTH39750.1 hypothetical protein J5M86_15155 [Yimella sp. cx-51]